MSQFFSLSSAFRDIAIQRGRLDDGEDSTAYNLESLCQWRGWHGYLSSRNFENGDISWNRDKPGVCSSDENRRTRVGAQNMQIAGGQSSSTRRAANNGRWVSFMLRPKYPFNGYLCGPFLYIAGCYLKRCTGSSHNSTINKFSLAADSLNNYLSGNL